MGSPSPDPRWRARRELARALFGLALGPLHLAAFLFERGAWTREIEAALLSPPPAPADPPAPAFPARPLRILVSCGEASSETHALRLVRELRVAAREGGAPPPEISGLGGPALGALGVELVGDPTARAAMAGQGVLRDVPFYLGLCEAAARAFRDRRPDVFAPIDAPALHVPLARIAKSYGVPTAHLVAPQHWAWGPWRAAAYRGAVARALTILPWEPAWFARAGVPTAHVGHPQVDLLAELGEAPGAEQRTELVLLPGSRAGEVRASLPWMLGVAADLARAHPLLPILVAQSRDEHAPLIRAELARADLAGRVRLELGDLHRSLGRARAALAVSGTVLTDLLHHRLPAVVVYPLRGRARSLLARWLVTCPWFASTNLLAGEEVYPEHAWRAGAPGPRRAVVVELERALFDPEARARSAAALERVAQRLGPPGAVARAARHVLAVAAGSAGPRSADPAAALLARGGADPGAGR